MLHNIGRKLKKSGKRLLKASRVAGRVLGKGTGFARKVIGKVDSFTGGMATNALMSNPYGQAAMVGLSRAEMAGKMLRNPQSTLKLGGVTALARARK